MSLKRDTSYCGSDLFSNYGSEIPSSVDMKQGAWPITQLFL